MTISMGTLIKNKYKIQKDLRKMDKTRTTKEERQANRQQYKLEKARQKRMENFKKCIAYANEIWV